MESREQTQIPVFTVTLQPDRSFGVLGKYPGSNAVLLTTFPTQLECYDWISSFLRRHGAQ
jgi:hypothetical protein